MTKSEFLNMIDDILELPPGTVKGDESLKALENWDSLAVVSYIASVHALLGVTLEAKKLKACTTVPELMALVSDKSEG